MSRAHGEDAPKGVLPPPRLSLRRAGQLRDVQFAERAGATDRANEAPLPRGPPPRAAERAGATMRPTAGPTKRCPRGPQKRMGDTMLPHRWADEAPLSEAGASSRRSRLAPRAPC